MISESNLYDSYENYKLQHSNKQYILPVTLVTGYLGSGKTTLVKHTLKNKLNLKIASVVNDFGEVNHDGAILEGVGLDKEAAKLTGDCMCCSADLKTGMKESIWDLLQAPNAVGSLRDQMDYLIIETSGVTDPTSIIELLEMRYGQLTRARLDCVVTVVDMDLLSSDLMTFGKTNSAAAEIQLQSADVIVLNKEDLVADERKEAALAYVSSVNPTAIVHTCSYGRLPLHHFLDLMVTANQAAEAVSHEKGGMPMLHVSPSGGKFRKMLKKKAATPRGGGPGLGKSNCCSSPSSCTHKHAVSELGGALKHLEIDGLKSVTFQSKRSLSLRKFQDFVSLYLPQGVVRMKGVLTFQEEPFKRAVFNMSGRKRLGFELDGAWTGPPSSYLVVIGNGLDEAAILNQIEGLLSSPRIPKEVETVGEIITEQICQEQPESTECTDISSQEQKVGQVEDEVATALALLESDLRFDVLDRSTTSDFTVDAAVYFRLTAARAFNLTWDQLHLRYGLNFNAMNHLCMNLVNAEGILLSCTRISCETDSNPQLWLRFSTGGDQKFQMIWPTILSCATETMRQHTNHINVCNCGC